MERREFNVKTDVMETCCKAVENTCIALCYEYSSGSTFSRKARQF